MWQYVAYGVIIGLVASVVIDLISLFIIRRVMGKEIYVL